MSDDTAPEIAPVRAEDAAAPNPQTEVAEIAPPQSTILDRLDFSAFSDLIEAGGPVTVILLVMSLVTLTVILAKLWQFARAGVGRRSRVERALSLWIAGENGRALAQLQGATGPAARVAAHAIAGLTSGTPESRVREDVERLALSELGSLRAYLRVIEATVQTAPLLGLFGTVLGMIASFQALEGAGAQADPAVLAGGIWVALLTTAVGLGIAIPAALVLTWFQGRIDREQDLIEDAATSIFTRRLAGQEETADAPTVGWPAPERREAL